jgi:hypothetical protein
MAATFRHNDRVRHTNGDTGTVLGETVTEPNGDVWTTVAWDDGDCERHHPSTLAPLVELTLDELVAAATVMGFPAEVTNTGGGVMALALTVHGHQALIALDYGHTSGSTWAVSLDGETREKYGEAEADDLPVTSDAEQTIRDAREWVLAHAVAVDR